MTKEQLIEFFKKGTVIFIPARWRKYNPCALGLKKEDRICIYCTMPCTETHGHEI